jgi:hypothetical protein
MDPECGTYRRWTCRAPRPRILLRCKTAGGSSEIAEHVTSSPRSAINLEGQLNNVVGLEFVLQEIVRLVKGIHRLFGVGA